MCLEHGGKPERLYNYNMDASTKNLNMFIEFVNFDLTFAGLIRTFHKFHKHMILQSKVFLKFSMDKRQIK